MNEQIKNNALRLRKQGKTYGEIIANLGHISKGSLSYWLSKARLSKAAVARIEKRKKINLERAQQAATETLRQKQENRTLAMRNQLFPLASRLADIKISKIALSFLYLGEGAKWKSHRGLQLGSSDPKIVLLYIKLLKKCYGIDINKFRCYICYRADQNFNKLKKYWAGILGIPLTSFYKSKPDIRTVGKPTKNKDYKGVCVLSCAGTNIQQELELIPNLILEGL